MFEVVFRRSKEFFLLFDRLLFLYLVEKSREFGLVVFEIIDLREEGLSSKIFSNSLFEE